MLVLMIGYAAASAAQAEVFPLAPDQDLIGEAGQTRPNGKILCPTSRAATTWGTMKSSRPIRASTPGCRAREPDPSADAASAAERSAHRHRDQSA